LPGQMGCREAGITSRHREHQRNRPDSNYKEISRSFLMGRCWHVRQPGERQAGVPAARAGAVIVAGDRPSGQPFQPPRAEPRTFFAGGVSTRLAGVVDDVLYSTPFSFTTNLNAWNTSCPDASPIEMRTSTCGSAKSLGTLQDNLPSGEIFMPA